MIEKLPQALEYIQGQLKRRANLPVDYVMLAQELRVHEDTAKDLLERLRVAGRIQCPRMPANGSGGGGGYFPAAIRVL